MTRKERELLGGLAIWLLIIAAFSVLAYVAGKKMAVRELHDIATCPTCGGTGVIVQEEAASEWREKPEPQVWIPPTHDEKPYEQKLAEAWCGKPIEEVNRVWHETRRTIYGDVVRSVHRDGYSIYEWVFVASNGNIVRVERWTKGNGLCGTGVVVTEEGGRE